MNKRTHGQPADAVYVGRPSKWGNPFSHLGGVSAAFATASRGEAVAAYRRWLRMHPDLVAAARHELAGRDLVCWCYPAECHAEVLLQVAAGADP